MTRVYPRRLACYRPGKESTMRQRYHLSSLLALWAGLTGCGGTQHSAAPAGDLRHPTALVGGWSLTTLRSPAGEPAPIQVRQKLLAPPVTIVLNRDGTSTQTIGSRRTPGRWAVEAGSLSITASAS